jgi:hypothetical protein
MGICCCLLDPQTNSHQGGILPIVRISASQYRLEKATAQVKTRTTRSRLEPAANSRGGQKALRTVLVATA